MLSSLFYNLFDKAINFISTIICPIIFEQNTLISMVSIDSITSAINFMYYHIFKNNIDSVSFYKSSIIDRYILYSISYLFYNLFIIFWWLDDLFIMKLLLMFIPIFADILLNDKCLILNKLRIEYTKKILSKILSKILVYFSCTYLNKNVIIKHGEIIPLIEDYPKIIDYIIDIMKNILMIILLNYVRNYSSTIYFSIKRLYKYKTSETLNSFVSKDHSKEMLINIIDTKNWQELLKPNTFKAIMHVYQTNPNNVSIFDYIVKINLSLTKFFTLWTLGSFGCILIPFIMFLMITINFIRHRTISKYKIIITNIILASILLGIIDNPLYIALFCEYGDIIIINNITSTIFRILYKKIKKKYNESTILKINEWIIITLYMIYYKNDGIILLGIKNGVSNVSFYCIVLYCSTYLSGFKIYHIMMNTIILFICDVINVVKIDRVITLCGSFYVSIKNLFGYKMITDDVFELDQYEFMSAISVDSNVKISKVASYQIIDNYMS